MLKKLIASVVVAGGIGLAGSSPAVAVPVTWPSNDTFVVGDAKWQVNALGIDAGWDAADIYQNAGFLSNPTSMYSTDYLYCGNGGGYYDDPIADFTDSVVTQETNGDISIQCPTWTAAWDTYPGLSMQSFIRFYHEERGGYLARYLTTFTNSTTNDITIDDLYLFGSALVPRDLDESKEYFLTSSGGSGLANGDTWSAAGNPFSSTPTVFLTSGWAKTGNGAGLTVANEDVYFYVPSETIIPASSSKSFVSYSFMAIPASQDAAGTNAAWDAVQAQAVEYASFDGRLTCGIPQGTVIEFWGTAPADSCATLPDTGVNPQGAGIALTVLAFGALLLVVSVRRRRNV
jgi:LPXTG-motif cell wall-anchored protein